MKKAIFLILIAINLYGQIVFNRASKLDSTLLTTQYRLDTTRLGLIGLIATGSTDTNIIATKSYVESRVDTRIPTSAIDVDVASVYSVDTAKSNLYAEIYTTRNMIPLDPIENGDSIKAVIDSNQTRLVQMIKQYGEWLIKTQKIRDGHPDTIYIINGGTSSGGLVPADTVVFRITSNNYYQYKLDTTIYVHWHDTAQFIHWADTNQLKQICGSSGGTSSYSAWTKVTGITKISDSLLIVPVGTWYKKGLPLKYRYSTGTEYYGIIHNIKNLNTNDQDTLIISGAPIPANCDTLKYGDANRVVKYDFGLLEYWSNYPVSGTTADSIIYLHTGAEFRWGLSNAYLVQFAGVTRVVDATSGTFLNVFKNNETLIGNYGINMTTGAGTWVFSSPSYINISNYKIEYNDFIDLRMIRADTTPDARNLTFSMWFILE